MTGYRKMYWMLRKRGYSSNVAKRMVREHFQRKKRHSKTGKHEEIRTRGKGDMEGYGYH
jgi:hypothetical protein